MSLCSQSFNGVLCDHPLLQGMEIFRIGWDDKQLLYWYFTKTVNTLTFDHQVDTVTCILLWIGTLCKVRSYWINLPVRSTPRPWINRLWIPNFFTLLFMLFSKVAAYEAYKFEWEIQIQSNDLNSLAASVQEKLLLGERFQKVYSVYLIRCLWVYLVQPFYF